GPAARELAGLPADDGLAAPARLAACLLRGRLAAAQGDTEEARRRQDEAVDLARPEGLRLPFAEGGARVRRTLREAPRPAARQGRPADGPPPAVAPPVVAPPVVESLSARETEVLRQAARMLSTEEIAAELYVSANTVKTHLKSIYRKLGVTRRSDAVHRAQALGLL
ncbi:LuxR C-terminal-related transcriptional regulator, partial [Streptomyces virginiae]|uniref:LuxR C-terminal-related transcriptional regulator n=1 Tax=Streptomyces virginiae TaxID=1961 RepID=UPI00361518A0